MNIRFLETFLWLCRLQNFNAVAEKLHTTQPSVSQRVATLEDLFRQKLYVRGAKKFELTPAGRHLLPYAERIIELSDEMHREIVLQDGSKKVVRVGIIEICTMSFLSEWVRLIGELEPEATVDFSTNTSAALTDSLVTDELDLALVWGSVNEPSIGNLHVCSFPMAWLGSPKHFECATPLDVIDLARMPIIMHREDSSGYLLIKDYFTTHGVVTVPASPQPISLNCSYSLATAMHLVRAGMGIMALPPFLMTDEIARGEVVAVPVTQALPDIDLTACYRTRDGSEQVARLIELVNVAASSFSNTLGPEYCRT